MTKAAGMKRFGVTMSDPDTIKLFDLRMLATERRDLLNWHGEQWSASHRAEPFAFEIIPWDADSAARAFLHRFNELAPEAARA